MSDDIITALLAMIFGLFGLAWVVAAATLEAADNIQKLDDRIKALESDRDALGVIEK